MTTTFDQVPSTGVQQLETSTLRKESLLWGTACLIAPSLLGISTLFWVSGRLGQLGGTLQVFAFLFWILTFFGTSRLTRATMPRFTLVLLVLGVYSSMGGANFGLEGVYSATLLKSGLSPERAGGILEAMGAWAGLLFFTPGLLFPVSLIMAGIALWKLRILAPWAASMLILGGALFPAGRIPRIEALAHVTDVLILVPMVLLAVGFFRGRLYHA